MLQNQLTLGSIFFHVAFVMIPDAPQSGVITVVTLELLVLMPDHSTVARIKWRRCRGWCQTTDMYL